MQVEKMHDFLSQKITYKERSAILLAVYPSVRGYSVKSTKRFWNKNGISPRIFHDHVRTMISEAVAEFPKNLHKIYFFE